MLEIRPSVTESKYAAAPSGSDAMMNRAARILRSKRPGIRSLKNLIANLAGVRWRS
jgi:hypothetical protein